MASFFVMALNQFIAGVKSSSVPPSARLIAMPAATPTKELDGSRKPTMPLYFGSVRSFQLVGIGLPPSASTFTNRPSVP